MSLAARNNFKITLNVHMDYANVKQYKIKKKLKQIFTDIKTVSKIFFFPEQQNQLKCFEFNKYNKIERKSMCFQKDVDLSIFDRH